MIMIRSVDSNRLVNHRVLLCCFRVLRTRNSIRNRDVRARRSIAASVLALIVVSAAKIFIGIVVIRS